MTAFSHVMECYAGVSSAEFTNEANAARQLQLLLQLSDEGYSVLKQNSSRPRPYNTT